MFVNDLFRNNDFVDYLSLNFNELILTETKVFIFYELCKVVDALRMESWVWFSQGWVLELPWYRFGHLLDWYLLNQPEGLSVKDVSPWLCCWAEWRIGFRARWTRRSKSDSACTYKASIARNLPRFSASLGHSHLTLNSFSLLLKIVRSGQCFPQGCSLHQCECHLRFGPCL